MLFRSIGQGPGGGSRPQPHHGRRNSDTGTVKSGLVGRTSLAYDLWGDAVSLAYRARSVTGRPGIYVSQAVRDRMQDSVVFAEAGAVDVAGTSKSVWRIES